jgi:hypothetical protein
VRGVTPLRCVHSFFCPRQQDYCRACPL